MATYGLILAGHIGDPVNGRRFGNLAKEIVKRKEHQAQKAEVFFLTASFIDLW